MPDNAQHQAVLAVLANSWLRMPQLGVSNFSTLLSAEVDALLAGEAAHLPYVQDRDRTVWMTVAPDAAALRAAITGLRAWIIPSFGWEDPARPIVSPSAYSGDLAVPLATVSPAGYYRWHSTTSAMTKTILPKLTSWRKLRSRKPQPNPRTNRSLFELREQFYLALATGDRPLAEESVQAIDHRQLDTASNTSFMRTRIRARFGSHDQIVHDPNLDRMLALRLPRVTSNAIIEAFFEFYIRPLIQSNRNSDAREYYRIALFPKLAGVLSVASESDGEGARWFLKELTTEAAPNVVINAPQSDEQSFINAVRTGDWRSVQQLGPVLEEIDGVPAILLQFVRSGLLESLKHEPNPDLERRIDPNGLRGDNKRPWRSFMADVLASRFAAAEAFLNLEQRPLLDLGDKQLLSLLLSQAEEIMTDPNGTVDDRFDFVSSRVLPLFIEDTVGDLDYPRCEIAFAYMTLLSLWVANRGGRAIAGESNVVLSLAAAILQCHSDMEAQVIHHLRIWWDRKPVKATLPYLLAALELLADFSSDHTTAQGLWIDGATFIKEHSVLLTSTELGLWRIIGNNLGFDLGTVDEYVPDKEISSQSEISEDIFAAQGLKKVAIVSLHEKSAKAAADIIRQRAGAEVVIVSDHVAGAATQNAQTADVVLVVWAATKHSVYRAFDKVRDKLAYVQGTGPSSILLALERWILTSK